MELLVGLDIGTTSAKAVLISPKGEILNKATFPYPLYTPKPGWVEQQPQDWWDATIHVLQKLTKSKRGTIVGLGITGQMHGAVFLDKDYKVIRPAILWNDARTGPQCRQIERIIGKDKLQQITGNPALAGFQAPKILWLREHEKRNYRKVRFVLLPKDYIRFKLTGELATDASDAAGTLLLDLKKRDWADEILQALNIPKKWLPTVYEGPAVTGYITADVAKLSGIPKGAPVVAGGGDNAASAIGAGVIQEGLGLVSLGTSGVIFVHCDEPISDPDGAIHCFCHAVPGKYHLMGVVLSAGASLRWFRDVFASEEQQVAARLGRDPYDLLLQEAEQAPPGADGLFFLPYLSGERTPHMDPDARGAWIGISLAHGRRHFIRAVLEGVAFALKDSLIRIQALGQHPKELRAVGGGVRNALWQQILASVLEIPLRRLSVEEGAAYGAALLAAVGSGFFKDVYEAVDNIVKPLEETINPDPQLSAIYKEIYAVYTRLYPTLKKARVFKITGRQLLE